MNSWIRISNVLLIKSPRPLWNTLLHSVWNEEQLSSATYWLTGRHPLKFVTRCVIKCSNRWLMWRSSKGADLSIKQWRRKVSPLFYMLFHRLDCYIYKYIKGKVYKWACAACSSWSLMFLDYWQTHRDLGLALWSIKIVLRTRTGHPQVASLYNTLVISLHKTLCRISIQIMKGSERMTWWKDEKPPIYLTSFFSVLYYLGIRWYGFLPHGATHHFIQWLEMETYLSWKINKQFRLHHISYAPVVNRQLSLLD